MQIDPVAAKQVMSDLEGKINGASQADFDRAVLDIQIQAHNAKVEMAKLEKRKRQRLKRALAGK